MDRFLIKLSLLAGVWKLILMAPAGSQPSTRQAKSLGYFDYVQPMVEYAYDNVDDYEDDLEDNEISRGLPKKKRVKTKPAFESPIYYIRLPPTPYMYIPGLGYVSQPPPPPQMPQLVNVPVSFISNGKPSGIYQWNGGLAPFASVPAQQVPIVEKPRPTESQKLPQKPVDSSVHRLPGTYTFNGKPNDIFVLRDSYNSFYSDALQNFYP